MRKSLLITILFSIIWSAAFALPTSKKQANESSIILSDSAKIYLLTCTPGTEVWSKYGHTGIRVYDIHNQLDIVFNYGIFSLMEKGFYLKFIQGETYYQLGIESYPYFVSFYSSIGRKTYLQELNLTQQQKQQVLDALLINYQPNNRYYLYNFVFDNCATRPYHLLKSALQDSIISDYQGYVNQPFRSTISHYTGPHSWVDFGINLVFGKKADQPMNNEQRLFLPEELMFYLSQAQLSDGTPLVINEHIQSFQIAPVAWYADSRLGLALFAIFMIVISIWDRKHHKLSWWLDAILCLVYLVLLAIVIFLTFFSVHPLVGFNWRLIILPCIHLCARLIYWLR
jgi:hypothetical protein